MRNIEMCEHCGIALVDCEYHGPRDDEWEVTLTGVDVLVCEPPRVGIDFGFGEDASTYLVYDGETWRHLFDEKEED